MDGLNLGYSYQLPYSGRSNGWGLKFRNTLSQCSDIFSEFNSYIAPAYHHDRCERTVNMRLYSMHKREFVMVLLSFFACFGLTVFIGFAGPPIASLTEKKAHVNASEMSTGPFVMSTPYLSTYSQQLWVIAKLTTSNTDDERYDESFRIVVSIDGISSLDKKIKHILTPLDFDHINNRTRHLTCERQSCEEIVIAHLGFIDHSRYVITVRFYGLESFHQRYTIKDLTFYFKHYNPAFTQIEIWFRLIFLTITFVAMCWFGNSLRKYPVNDWSIEQKWTSVLLPLLILYNNPLFPMIFLINSSLPGTMDAFFQTTFLSAILLFWLCVYHGLRQNERKMMTFYLPKFFIVGSLWTTTLFLSIWLRWSEMDDPTYNYAVDTFNYYYGFKVFYLIMSGIYLVYLLLLMIRAYSELRTMPYFDQRLRFMTLFVAIVIGTLALITKRQYGAAGILEDSFVSRLSTRYRTSAQFMALYGLLNFYLYTMTYAYAPVSQQVYGQHTLMTKDNPSFSMINDSDEEVIYDGGSDDESRRPLTTRVVRNNTDDSD